MSAQLLPSLTFRSSKAKAMVDGLFARAFASLLFFFGPVRESQVKKGKEVGDGQQSGAQLSGATALGECGVHMPSEEQCVREPRRDDW